MSKIRILGEDYLKFNIEIKTDKKFRNILEFFNKDGEKAIKQKLSSIYGYFDKDNSIRGFICISTGIIKPKKHISVLMPGSCSDLIGITYPLPAILIGKLLVNQKNRGERIGEKLLLFTLAEAFTLSARVGVRFVIVDSHNDAIGFYEKYGFIVLEKGSTTKMIFDLKAYSS